MTVAQRIGALEHNLEMARQSGEFISLCRVLLAAKGSLFEARHVVENQGRVSKRVRDLIDSDQCLQIVRHGSGPQTIPRGNQGNAGDQWISQKSAAGAFTLLDSTSFGTYQLLVSGFINALSSVGVFDQMRGSMRQVPIGRTVGATSLAAVGYTVSEGSAKQVSKLSFTSGSLRATEESYALSRSPTSF